MSDISKKPSWMVGEMSECGNFRIDCALGVELKRIRLAHELTLMNMSEALGWGPAKLSNYEHNVGALTCPLDALTIDRYCVDNRYSLSDSAIVLAHRSVRTDLTKARELIADIRKLAGVEE